MPVLLPEPDMIRAEHIRDTILNAIKIEQITDPTDTITVFEALAAVSGRIIKACPPDYPDREEWQNAASFYLARRIGMYHGEYIKDEFPFDNILRDKHGR